MQLLKFLQTLFFFSLLAGLTHCDAVCDENTLITELRQDVADNNQLDCLRYIRDAPKDHEETPEEKKNRVAAVWDSDCSFEADYDWLSRLKEIYGLENGLVDVNGDSVKEDFDDQADMCEIVRAMIAGGKVPTAKADVKYIEEDAFDAIDCPGDGESGQSEICAVNGGSAGQKYAWYILLEGISFNFNGKPSFTKVESK